MWKKKVWKTTNNDNKVLQNLYEVRSGLPAKTLVKLTGLKQSTVYKRLNILLEKKLIEKISPLWKISNGQVDFVDNLLANDNIFELHNLSYVVKLIRVPEWWNKRKNYLMRLKGWEFKNVNFGKADSNPYQQLINENWVVQIYPESVIIMARKRYYGNQPYDVITEATHEFFDFWEWFEERMRFKFFLNGSPQVSIRSNDFNRMKDHLANNCKKDGTKFLVEIDKKRKVWVDYSEPFGKEANYPHGQEILEKVTKDHLINKPMLNSELQLVMGEAARQIKDIANNQEIFDRNISLHQEVLREIRDAIVELKDVAGKINKD